MRTCEGCRVRDAKGSETRRLKATTNLAVVEQPVGGVHAQADDQDSPDDDGERREDVDLHSRASSDILRDGDRTPGLERARVCASEG